MHMKSCKLLIPLNQEKKSKEQKQKTEGTRGAGREGGSELEGGTLAINKN